MRLHIEWDNRGLEDEQIPVWTADRGRVSMKLTDFLGELRDFDARLIRAMGERVTEILTGGAPEGVFIDMEHLQYEQRERATWLSSAMEQRVRPNAARALAAGWEEQFALLERLEARLDAI